MTVQNTQIQTMCVLRHGQVETGEKVAMASSFVIVYEKSEGNSIEHKRSDI